MDTISAYLNGMRIFNFEAGSAESRPPWGVEMPGGKWDIVFYAFEGEPFRLSIDSGPVHRIKCPSICLILKRTPHIVEGEGPAVAKMPADIRMPDTIEQFRFKVLGGDTGPSTRVFYMGLDVGGCSENPLLEGLPELLTLNPQSMPPWLTMGSNWLRDELLADRTGRHSTASRLGELLVIEGIRAYVDEHRDAVPAWSRPTADPRLTRALGLLHSNLSRNWTLEDLATMAGTSRSRLSACAQAELGEGIFRYLQRWRMFEARRLLRETSFEIAKIARLVGYGAQNAFITAFGREVGVSPNRYRNSFETAKGDPSGDTPAA